MSLIGSVSGIQSALLSRLSGTGATDTAGTTKLSPLATPAGVSGTTPANFGSVFDQMVSAVDAKQKDAQAVTRQVLLGQNDQLHQSVIAMQEAGVAFQLMVEVRNKVVESYQELMRTPV